MIALAKALCNGQYGSKIKNAENIKKRFYNNIRAVLFKKPLEKSPNIPEMR